MLTTYLLASMKSDVAKTVFPAVGSHLSAPMTKPWSEENNVDKLFILLGFTWNAL